MPNKKDRLSSVERRRLEEEASKWGSDALDKELKKHSNPRVRQKPNKDLEIKIEL